MRARRALVIGPTPPPVGGDTVSTRRLLDSTYWREIGVEPIHVNTSPGDRVRVAGERLTLRDIARGVSILMRVLPLLPRTDVVLLWANSRFLCTIGIPIIALGRLARRPVVVKFFGVSLTDFIRRMPAPWRWVALNTLALPRFLFPQTERLADELVREFGIDSGRVVRLPNYLPDRMLEETFEQRRFTGRCVFLGQVKREKGVFDIIEALAGLTEFTCDVYGPVLERDSAEFFERIEGVPNVRYRGVASPDDVHRIVGGYELLLLPSYHAGEGYPAVVLEAFAAGVPAVATDWKSIPDIVADGERGILVPVRSPEAIRAALGRIAADGALYESLTRNAYAYARRYSERTVVRDILLDRVRRMCSTAADRS